MKLLLVCLSILLCTILSADTLYYQIPDTINAIGYRCQLDSAWPYESEIVDDIIPTGDGWGIDSVIAWFCNWGGFATWNQVPNIHFLVYEDSIGQPADSPMIEIVVEQSEYTAYYINGSDPNRWRVEMNLPTSVMLDTFKYWIEIQPSNDMTVNGLTGNMASVGIGNGQCFFMRFPLAGVPVWESAVSLFAQDLETGFILLGSELGITERRACITDNQDYIGATIISGPLIPPQGKEYRLYDIMGRVITLNEIRSGVYFIEIDGEIKQKIIKIR